jgi:DNA-binding transcriptional LysR family regulator
MDRLEAMSFLLAVVDAGSISAASRRLRVPLATVSRKLSLLEAHLKVQLLTRTNRSSRIFSRTTQASMSAWHWWIAV